MRSILDKFRPPKPAPDPPAPLTADIATYRQQQREATAKLMNGEQVLDDLQRAARSFAEEVRRPPRRPSRA